MNRINQLFQNSPQNLLSIYFCAGCPTLDGTADVIRTLEKNGVDMIEIGIPFSDPMADGIVIQDAATRAQLTRMNAAVMGTDSDPHTADIDGISQSYPALRL